MLSGFTALAAAPSLVAASSVAALPSRTLSASLTAFASDNRFWIQLALIVGVGTAGVLLLRSTAGARHQAIRRLAMTAFGVAAIYFIMAPSAATRVARLLGVGRGADLLLYALVIAFLGYLASSFKRIAGLEGRITELARQLALAQAPRPDHLDDPNYRHSAPNEEGIHSSDPPTPAAADGNDAPTSNGAGATSSVPTGRPAPKDEGGHQAS